jgi:hypothetical protein
MPGVDGLDADGAASDGVVLGAAPDGVVLGAASDGVVLGEGTSGTADDSTLAAPDPVSAESVDELEQAAVRPPTATREITRAITVRRIYRP